MRQSAYSTSLMDTFKAPQLLRFFQLLQHETIKPWWAPTATTVEHLMMPPAPKRWPAVDTSSFSHLCVLSNEVRCIFNVSAAGDSLRDSNCVDGKGASAACSVTLEASPSLLHRARNSVIKLFQCIITYRFIKKRSFEAIKNPVYSETMRRNHLKAISSLIRNFSKCAELCYCEI